MRMPHIVICGPPGRTVFFHITLPMVWFSRGGTWNVFLFLFPLHLFSKTFLILKRTERAMIKNCKDLHVKYPLFVSDFNETWIFSACFRKMFKYEILWQSVQLDPSCSMRTNGQTDMTKLKSLFLQFCEKRLKTQSWNCSNSKGWTREEESILRKQVMTHFKQLLKYFRL